MQIRIRVEERNPKSNVHVFQTNYYGSISLSPLLSHDCLVSIEHRMSRMLNPGNSLLNFQKNSRNFVKPITQLSNPSYCLAAATKWAKAKTKAANSCPQRTRKQEQRSVAWKTARTSHRETTRTALPQEDGHVALNAKEQAVFEQAKVLAPCLVLW